MVYMAGLGVETFVVDRFGYRSVEQSARSGSHDKRPEVPRYESTYAQHESGPIVVRSQQRNGRAAPSPLGLSLGRRRTRQDKRAGLFVLACMKPDGAGWSLTGEPAWLASRTPSISRIHTFHSHL